jgi:uncharacterized membrane protein
MTKCGHLWAVGFDDTGRAAQVRGQITDLARGKHQLILLDVAVAVRYCDGCLTLNGEPFAELSKDCGGKIGGLLTGLSLDAPPLSGPAVGAMFARLGATKAEDGISDDFVRAVEDLIKPGTSVLFVLDEGGDMDASCKRSEDWAGPC